jgi:hypothetical protein
MIFSQFSESNSCAQVNMEEQQPQLAPEFDREAAPPPERVSVTLDLDADILAWLKGQHLGLAGRNQEHPAVFHGNQQRAGSAAAPGQRGGLYP